MTAVEDVEIAGAVKSNGSWSGEKCRRSGAAISDIPRDSSAGISRDCGDDAGSGRYLADDAITQVGDVQVAVAIQGERVRLEKTRAAGRSAVPGAALAAGPRVKRNGSAGS